MTAESTDDTRPMLERASRGYRSMVTTQGIRLLCKVISVVVIARLVSPTDHGLFAMASSIFALLALFRDGGLGTAAIQAHQLDAAQRNTLFWVHLLLGGALALITLAVASGAANFYASPEVANLLKTMSCAFILIGAGGFMRSKLYRDLQFQDANRSETISAVISTIVMLTAAWLGAGAYAFVLFLIVSEGTATALAWRYQVWRPSGFPQWRSIRPLFRTGKNLTLHQLIEALLLQLDTLALGRWFGAYPLGLYNRAAQLITLPANYMVAPLGQVMLATLSRLTAQSTEFKRHAWGTVTAVAHLTLPLFALCLILPEITVRIVFGPQWLSVAPVIQILAFGGIGVMITSLAYAITVAMGHAHRLVVSSAIALVTTAVAIAIGIRYGMIGVATGVALSSLLMAPARVWWLLHELPGGVGEFFRALKGPALAMSVFSLGVFSVSFFMSDSSWHWFIQFVAALGGGIVAVGLLGVLSPTLRSEWNATWQLLPFNREKKSAHSPPALS